MLDALRFNWILGHVMILGHQEQPEPYSDGSRNSERNPTLHQDFVISNRTRTGFPLVERRSGSRIFKASSWINNHFLERRNTEEHRCCQNPETHWSRRTVATEERGSIDSILYLLEAWDMAREQCMHDDIIGTLWTFSRRFTRTRSKRVIYM